MDMRDPVSEAPVGRRKGPSGAAAIAVVVAAVLGWWVFSGNGPQGPSGNDARYAVPDVDATPTGGDARFTAPEASPGTVPIDSYVVRDELRLTLNFRIAADCATALETPRVIEGDAAVTITLPLDAGPECSEAVERRTLGVLLDSPLSGRAVLDGARSPQVRVAPTDAAYE